MSEREAYTQRHKTSLTDMLFVVVASCNCEDLAGLQTVFFLKKAHSDVITTRPGTSPCGKMVPGELVSLLGNVPVHKRKQVCHA